MFVKLERSFSTACLILFATITLAATLLLGGAKQGMAQVDPATADLTDDAGVNILDVSTLASRFGKNAGEDGYREGLDIVPDGIIDLNDLSAVLGQFGQTGAKTDGTLFRGRVFDGLGNALAGVRVQVGANTVQGCTAQDGSYALPIGAADLGENEVTFDGSGGGLCTPVDPTPQFLSGQYPTIPHKPIYVNGGLENVFRDMSLPERDLAGSVPLDESNSEAVDANTRRLLTDVEIKNAGVELEIPGGCEVSFPQGEDQRISITRVDPAMLPVPMPPGLSSTIFVTYQPGETEISCPGGTEIFTEFDNDDGFPNGQGDLMDGPFLAGIVNGVFKPLAACEVSGAIEDPPGIFTGGIVRCGPIPLPFGFAWYHTDIRPPVPCPRTTVIGRVVDTSNGDSPVAGANVSVPGAIPVTTASDGTFSIPNVAAGPNGPNCDINPFSIRASAAKDLDADGAIGGSELGISAVVDAVPGGNTDVMDILLGLETGTVRGRVQKLTSVTPFVRKSLEGAVLDLNPTLGGDLGDLTDRKGTYRISDVPQGTYDIVANFAGTVPLPGGGEAAKNFSGSQSGNIDFPGKTEVRDFYFTGAGSVKVTVVDEDANPQPFVEFDLEAFGGSLGQGFVAPADTFFSSTAVDGMRTVNGVPQGPCEVRVIDSSNGNDPIAVLGPEEGCFVNEHGQLLELTVVKPFCVCPEGTVLESCIAGGQFTCTGSGISCEASSLCPAGTKIQSCSPTSLQCVSVGPPTGRELFFMGNIIGADEVFQQDLLSNPNDKEAHFFRAITRIVRLVEENQDGPDLGTFTDSVKEMLDRFGFPAGGRGIFDLEQMLPGPVNRLPADSPTGADVQQFFADVVLPEVSGAVDENLLALDASFSLVITPEELDKLGITDEGPIEIDFGEVKFLEAALTALRGDLLIALANNFDVDIDELTSIAGIFNIQQEIFDPYPDLLKLTPSGADFLAEAKVAMIDAIDAYTAASDFIRSEADDQSDDLTVIMNQDLQEEKAFRQTLERVRNSLTGLPEPLPQAVLVGPMDHRSKGLAWSEGTLYSISSRDALLRVLDPTDGSTISSTTITLAGKTVWRGNGLTATGNGGLFALLHLEGQQGRELVFISNPTTGAATSLLNTGDRFAGIAYNPAEAIAGQQLLAVTGSGANTPNALFFFAQGTPLCTLGRGNRGQAIAFRVEEIMGFQIGILYHASGRVFESISPGYMSADPCAIRTDFRLASSSYGEPRALTYSDTIEAFFLAGGNDELFRIDSVDVDLSPVFDNPVVLRNVLPELGFDPVEESPNFVVPGTFPDPDFGGVFQGMTQADLDELFELE